MEKPAFLSVPLAEPPRVGIGRAFMAVVRALNFAKVMGSIAARRIGIIVAPSFRRNDVIDAKASIMIPSMVERFLLRRRLTRDFATTAPQNFDAIAGSKNGRFSWRILSRPTQARPDSAPQTTSRRN